MRSLVESLIRNKNKNPNKIIFADENKSITNQELYVNQCKLHLIYLIIIINQL